jgi:hypothetical protein
MTALFGLRAGQQALEKTGWPGMIAILAIIAILFVWPRIMGR